MDPPHFKIENVAAIWGNVDVMWKLVEECGCFMEQYGCNVDPPHIHISQFDEFLTPSWSVILIYAIVDVMWIFHISTLTIELTANPIYKLYSSMYLLSVS